MALKRNLAVMLVTALLGGATVAPAAAQPAAPTGILLNADLQPYLVDRNANKLFDNLEVRLATTPSHADEKFDVVVRLQGDAQAAAVSGALGVKPRTVWSRTIRGFSAEVTREELLRLLEDPAVRSVEENIRITRQMDTASLWTGVQAARRAFGVDGRAGSDPRNYSRDDVVVAVIDTGLDARHQDLAGGKVIGWHDAVYGIPMPYDDQGHGTHVASIIAGAGAASGGKYTGVAPGAALVGVKVMDVTGGGTLESVISGVEWVVANRERFNIRIANMSLGGGACADGTDALSAATVAGVQAGIAFVVAAGNSGPGPCTIGTPAAAEEVITVGAAYDPGENGWSIAEFSSRGPTGDGRIKPDLITPGRNITAAKANSKDQYITHSGTSMATPFMAGILALMLDANPSLSVDGLKDIVYDPANLRDYGLPGKDPEYGYGLALAYYDVMAAGEFRGRDWSDQIRHEFRTGDLGYDGAKQTFTYRVTDPSRPLALSMVIPGWEQVKFGLGLPAYRMELFDPRGKSVAVSKGASRQELVLYKPVRRGTYTLQIRSLMGNGPFQLDASYR